MKRKRIEKKYVDHGFGFPVIIENVGIAEWHGEEVPMIDHFVLANLLLRSFPDKPARLTGAEIRFIRKFFEMTLLEFGRQFGVSHVAVKKWEDKGMNPTKMSWSTEKDIRMFVVRRLGLKPSQFVALYDRLRNEPPMQGKPLSISASAIARGASSTKPSRYVSLPASG